MQQSATTVNVPGDNATLRRVDLHSAYLQLKNGTQVIDGNGGGNGRVAHAVGGGTETIRFGRSTYRFYRDTQNHDLKYVRIGDDGQVGSPVVLDGAGGGSGRMNGRTGLNPSAVVHDGALHVFYGNEGGERLRHARFSWGHWSFSDVEAQGDIGHQPSAVVYDEQLNVFHHDRGNGDLRRCAQEEAGWNCETINGDQAILGKVNANVGSQIDTLNWGVALYVFFRDDSNQTLRSAYIRPGRAGFSLSVVDGVGGGNGQTLDSVGKGLSAGLFQGRPAVAYLNDTQDDLRLARFTLRGWKSTTLDGHTNNFGRTRNAIEYQTAVATAGNVFHVFYFDRTEANLKVAQVRPENNGVGIRAAAVDGIDINGPRGQRGGFIGTAVSAVTVNDQAQLTYNDGTMRDVHAGAYGL